MDGFTGFCRFSVILLSRIAEKGTIAAHLTMPKHEPVREKAKADFSSIMHDEDNISTGLAAIKTLLRALQSSKGA